jgi:hypothetical protein
VWGEENKELLLDGYRSWDNEKALEINKGGVTMINTT